MSRRSNAAFRCTRCRLHQTLCVCALIPTLATRTRLLLIMHKAEDKKSTNSGRLASLCLPNSEVVVRGQPDQPLSTLAWPAHTLPVLLFPHPDAIALETFRDRPEPITLIVPDGNWRQASKVRKRVPGLAQVACVTLPAGPPSVYRLRSEAHAHGLSTLEAIARALGILEGPGVQRAIETVFVTMVERSLWARGALDAAAVSGGIPDGAVRHDPRKLSSS